MATRKTKQKLVDQNKTHETEEHRINQKDVLNRFCEKFQISWGPTKKFARCDATLYENDKMVGRAEVKCRTTPAETYPTYTVDARKVNKLFYESQETGTKGYLIVSWAGDIRYMLVTHVNYPVTFQKRRDRAEKADRMYNIPVEEFTKL